MRMMILGALSALVLFPNVASAKTCKSKGKKPEVFINGKTPVRRGPGLNYPVASFLERGTCAPYSEVSLDKSWVLVDIKDKLGWVPTSRLDAAGQKRVAGIEVKETAPVGSGQARAYGSITKQSVLLDGPNARASARRVLPQGLQVLPLAKTADGLWIQVRDERGDVGWIPTSDVAGASLAELPDLETDQTNYAEVNNSTSTVAGEQNIVVGDPRPVPTTGAIVIDAAVFGAALLPRHSLTSDGAALQRRYDVASFTPGTGVDIEVSQLGPLSVRVQYMFGLLVGLSPEDKPNIALSGTQHDAVLRVGFPIATGAAIITPELGYAFGMFDIDPALPGGPPGQTFVSSQTHAGTGGVRFQYYVTPDVMLDGSASVLVGITTEGRRTLGNAGLTLGAVGGAGLRYFITDSVGLMAQYALNLRSTGYTGKGSLDESIQEATLTDLTHGALLGVTFRFATE